LPEGIWSETEFFIEDFAGLSVELDLNKQLHIGRIDDCSSAGAVEQMAKQDKTFERIFIEVCVQDRQRGSIGEGDFLSSPRMCPAFDSTCERESQM